MQARCVSGWELARHGPHQVTLSSVLLAGCVPVPLLQKPPLYSGASQLGR